MQTCVSVQNIPFKTRGCKSTVLPLEATTTVTSRPLAKANQKAKVTACCNDKWLHPQLVVPKIAWLSLHKCKQCTLMTVMDI